MVKVPILHSLSICLASHSTLQEIHLATNFTIFKTDMEGKYKVTQSHLNCIDGKQRGPEKEGICSRTCSDLDLGQNPDVLIPG